MVGDLRGSRARGEELEVRPKLYLEAVKTSPDGSGSSLRPAELGGGHGVPLEVQPPVEAAPDDGGGRVGERVGGDDVDDGADDSAAVLLDGRQQWLQPCLVHLAVAVQEHEHLTWTRTQVNQTAI